MLNFASDYTEGCHPKVLEALTRTNMEQLTGYGTDIYSDRAKEKIRAFIGHPEAEIFFLTGGTQTNQTVIDTTLRMYEGVVAVQSGHVNCHEAGAIEFTGHKVLTLPSHDGKMDAAELDHMVAAFYADGDHDHMVFPGMVYISHPTEYGTLYRKAELEAFNADPQRQLTYQSGDIVGKSGVEYQYENVLQGVRGSRKVYVDVSGDILGIASEVDPEPGSDVRLTVDATVQAAAEQALLLGLEASDYLHYKPTGASCVCINCKTGEVLAMASYPTFDPSAFIGGISTDAWAQLIAEGANTPLLNRAINGLYPSASTIKPFTTCAALESGMTTTSSLVECTGYWTGFGEQYGMHCWNHSGHGWMNLYEGITNSCDTVFYEIAKAFYYSDHPEGIQEMFRRWGIGSATGIDLPAESQGRVPDAEWKWNHYTWVEDSARAWQGGDTANIAIGQGDILVTPLQMCYAYCGLVNGAVEMWPHVLLDVLSNQTREPIITAEQKPSCEVSISQDILSFVNDALVGVVNETYVGDYFAGLPVTVMGKSGTGEAGDDDDNPHAWFCAAAPAEDPTYVVAAIVEHGGGGGYVASNVCRGVLGAVYGVEMTDPVSILMTREVSTEQVMD